MSPALTFSPVVFEPYFLRRHLPRALSRAHFQSSAPSCADFLPKCQILPGMHGLALIVTVILTVPRHVCVHRLRVLCARRGETERALAGGSRAEIGVPRKFFAGSRPGGER